MLMMSLGLFRFMIELLCRHCITLKQEERLFSRLMRKQADQSGATREEIRSDRVKENKVCLPVFLTFFEHIIQSSWFIMS